MSLTPAMIFRRPLWWWGVVVFMALIGLGSSVASAQSEPSTPSPSRSETAEAQPTHVLSDAAVVSVITLGPGEAIHTIYGHTALRFHDPNRSLDGIRPLDLRFDFGLFDYGDGFMNKFIHGQTDYMLGVVDNHGFEQYIHDVDGRPYFEQRLNLTPDEARRMFDRLTENLKPENATYRYRFLDDNCATRVLALIEASTEREVVYPDEPPMGGTYRQMLRRYTADRFWLQTGIDLVLGAEVDQTPNAKQSGFLPIQLAVLLEQMTLKDVDGQSASAVALVVDANGLKPQSTAGSLALNELKDPAFSTISTVLLIITSALLLAAILFHKRTPLWLMYIFDVVLLIIPGMAGLLLLYMWLATAHTVTAWNADLLWANPLWLILYGWLVMKPLERSQTRLFRACVVALLLLVIYMVPSGLMVELGALMSLLMLLRLAIGQPGLLAQRRKAAPASGVKS